VRYRIPCPILLACAGFVLTQGNDAGHGRVCVKAIYVFFVHAGAALEDLASAREKFLT